MERPTNVEQLIERQMKMWEVRRQLAEEGGPAARQALVHLSEGPWITVSRQYGSNGTELAGILSERLGWQTFDREILQTIAEETRTRERILSRLDGQAVGMFTDYIAHLLVPDSTGQATYLREVSRVVWALARQGKAIVLGRGANWFLDPRFGLRLRTVAPMENRIARISAREGIEPAAAEKRVREADEQKQRFIRQAYGREIGDPAGYDLVLNLGTLGMEIAAETTLMALRRKLGG
jgi:cytidylate kinase